MRRRSHERLAARTSPHTRSARSTAAEARAVEAHLAELRALPRRAPLARAGGRRCWPSRSSRSTPPPRLRERADGDRARSGEAARGESRRRSGGWRHGPLRPGRPRSRSPRSPSAGIAGYALRGGDGDDGGRRSHGPVPVRAGGDRRRRRARPPTATRRRCASATCRRSTTRTASTRCGSSTATPVRASSASSCPMRTAAPTAAIPGRPRGRRAVMVTEEPERGRAEADAAAAVPSDARPLAPRRAPRSFVAVARDLLPAPRPRDERLVLALRAADLPRVHDAVPGRDALPRVRRRPHARPTAIALRPPRGAVRDLRPDRAQRRSSSSPRSQAAAAAASLDGGGQLDHRRRPGCGPRGRRAASGTGSSPAASCTPARCTCSSTCSCSTSSAGSSSRRSAPRALARRSTSSRCSRRARGAAAEPRPAHGRRLGRGLRAHGRDVPHRPQPRRRAARLADRDLDRDQPRVHVQRPRHQHRRPPRRARGRRGRRGADHRRRAPPRARRRR